MFYLSPEGVRYNIGRPFTYQSIQYSSVGASHNTFISLGFKQVHVQPRPNDKLYIVSGPNNDGSWNATPRDLVALQEAAVGKARAVCGQTLSTTDWMVVREMDDGTPMDPDVKAYRASVRKACSDYEAAIYACECLEDLTTFELPSEDVVPE